jgi:hypothetical protein
MAPVPQDDPASLHEVVDGNKPYTLTHSHEKDYCTSRDKNLWRSSHGGGRRTPSPRHLLEGFMPGADPDETSFCLSFVGHT